MWIQNEDETQISTTLSVTSSLLDTDKAGEIIVLLGWIDFPLSLYISGNFPILSHPFAHEI